MEDVAVEAAPDATETPSAGTPAVESETPSVDAQAGTAGDAPAAAQVDELLRFAQSRGHKDLDDKARNDIGGFLGRTLTQNKEYTQEIERLKAELAQRATPATPPQPETPPELPPDLKAIDEQISSLKAELGTFPEAERAIVRSILEANQKIAIQVALQERADPLDKPSFDLEIGRLKGELALLQRQMNVLPREKAALEAEIRRATRERAQVESSIEAEERERQEAEADREKWNEGFRHTVNTLIPRFADELKVDSSPELRKSMLGTVTRLVGWELLQRSQAQISDVDVPALVKACVEYWAKENGLIRSSQQALVDREKAAVSRTTTPQRTAPPKTDPNTQRELSPEERYQRDREARVASMSRRV